MSGFVYIWRDRKHKRFYIGSHWGSPDDGYICSSSWMMQLEGRKKIAAKSSEWRWITNGKDNQRIHLSTIDSIPVGYRYGRHIISRSP